MKFVVLVLAIAFAGCATSNPKIIAGTKPKVQTPYELCMKRCDKVDPPGDTIGHLITDCKTNCTVNHRSPSEDVRF